MKEKELEKAAAEQQRKAKREEQERRRKERKAEREKKKQTRRRTRRCQQKQVSESEDESSNTEYHCGECGQPYGAMKSYGLGAMGIVMAGTMLSALVFRKGAYQKTSTVINV